MKIENFNNKAKKKCLSNCINCPKLEHVYSAVAAVYKDNNIKQQAEQNKVGFKHM